MRINSNDVFDVSVDKEIDMEKGSYGLDELVIMEEPYFQMYHFDGSNL